MASDTDTKNSKEKAHQSYGPRRWFRLAPHRPDVPELEHLLDFYWGGPERRITGITLRIIAVNALALFILMFGIIYLGQYQSSLITARLQTFETELKLISAALSEKTLETNQNTDTGRIVYDRAKPLVARLASISRQRIQIFDTQGTQILDSTSLPLTESWPNQQLLNRTHFQSIETLKSLARVIMGLFPDRQTLPYYPDTHGKNARLIPDASDALSNTVSLSVWHNKNEKFFLSAAAPLLIEDKVAGVVLLTREGTEMEEDIARVWLDVLKVFFVALILTIMLSIYLSGVIARPLKKLARAAERVRRGQARADEIPDLSHRHDEIGELSLALKQMTNALWERMDSIEHFAADVSHELKNPLTSLSSAIETASIVKKASDRKKMMDIIKHDVQRLDRLISDISSASRIDSELSREAFEKISLRTMLCGLIEAYSKNPLERSNTHHQSWDRSIHAKKATIKLKNTRPEDIILWGLEGRLAQVFQNLLSNALSFSPEGGIITVDVTQMATKVRITVEDQGPGIPKNKIQTIFDRFYSERPEHEHYGQHSGLGLSICRQIVEAHGGQIFAENIYGPEEKPRGACFTVLLNKA